MKIKEKCVICQGLIRGKGYDPKPIKPEGKCCARCNNRHVIPVRLTSILK